MPLQRQDDTDAPRTARSGRQGLHDAGLPQAHSTDRRAGVREGAGRGSVRSQYVPDHGTPVQSHDHEHLPAITTAEAAPCLHGFAG